jgi:hypothetical protein
VKDDKHDFSIVAAFDDAIVFINFLVIRLYIATIVEFLGLIPFIDLKRCDRSTFF